MIIHIHKEEVVIVLMNATTGAAELMAGVVIVVESLKAWDEAVAFWLLAMRRTIDFVVGEVGEKGILIEEEDQVRLLIGEIDKVRLGSNMIDKGNQNLMQVEICLKSSYSDIISLGNVILKLILSISFVKYKTGK